MKKQSAGWSILVLAACSGGPSDTEPPTLRDLQVSLGSDVANTVNLSDADATRVVLEPTTVSMRVFASDDNSEVEDLNVSLIDRVTQQRLQSQSSRLERGLWLIEAVAEAGTSVTVRVQDAARNEATWPWAVIFLGREAALERTWMRLVLDERALELERPHSTWGNGEFCVDGFGGSPPRGGTYAVTAQEQLLTEQRHQLPCTTEDFGSEWASIESTRTSNFYVDETYFTEQPFRRVEGSGSAIQGIWEHLRTEAEDVVDTRITLREDGRFERASDEMVIEGSYRVATNGSYEESFGDFLIEQVDTIDGLAVPTETRVSLHVVRSGHLLLNPWIEAP